MLLRAENKTGFKNVGRGARHQAFPGERVARMGRTRVPGQLRDGGGSGACRRGVSAGRRRRARVSPAPTAPEPVPACAATTYSRGRGGAGAGPRREHDGRERVHEGLLPVTPFQASHYVGAEGQKKQKFLGNFATAEEAAPTARKLRGSATAPAATPVEVPERSVHLVEILHSLPGARPRAAAAVVQGAPDRQDAADRGSWQAQVERRRAERGWPVAVRRHAGSPTGRRRRDHGTAGGRGGGGGAVEGEAYGLSPPGSPRRRRASTSRRPRRRSWRPRRCRCGGARRARARTSTTLAKASRRWVELAREAPLEAEESAREALEEAPTVTEAEGLQLHLKAGNGTGYKGAFPPPLRAATARGTASRRSTANGVW